MAAKLLHSLTDDNPDLQKQIGCMAGIFQLFDHHHILTGRRISHKRLLPGNSYLNSSLETNSTNVGHRHTAAGKNSNKSVNEKQKFSTESSRVSFSSSSCSSSMSSLECNKTAQPEPCSFDRIIFPETHSRDPAMNQLSASPQLGRQSLDLRDLVKDSMYREVRGLSVKTTTREEAVGHAVKPKDSPRPSQPSKSMDGSYGVGTKGKQNVPVDLKESLRVLAKLREAPWYFNEARELPRSSYEAKDGPLPSIPKDAPRFSYDGREINRLSFESQDTSKGTPKLKELPRLSLDSREGSMRGSNFDSRSNSVLRNLQKGSANSKDNVPNLKQISESQKRPPSVVAKLMGLEALPDSISVHDSQMGLIRTCPIQDCDPFSRSPKTPDPSSRPIQMPYSPRSSWKEPTSPRWRNPDSVMKPISSSRFPIEPAPWRQQDGSRGSLKPASRNIKAPARAPNSFPSVYSEIEKRLKDLEFKQSGKDLRALKQILEAMQAKGLLETRREEQPSNFGTKRDEPKYTSFDQKVRLASQRKTQHDTVCAATAGGANSRRSFDSPIVIMKPAKLVEKSSIPASSVISIDGFSSFHKPQGGNFADNRKDSVNSQTAKVFTPKNSSRDHVTSSIDKRSNVRNSRAAQTPTRPQQLPKENTSSLVKSSGSVSPRLQQKKLELEKRSRLPSTSSELGKSRRQSHKMPTESSSPGGKRRPKSPNLQQSDDQLSEISSESRNLSYQGDDISVHSDSNMEVTSTEHSTEINGSRSPSMKAANCPTSGLLKKKSTSRLAEDVSLAELATIAPEQPSPVSVLDASVYIDDAPSPVKQTPTALKDNGSWNSSNNHDEEQWKLKDDILSNSTGSGVTSEINRKKLQNIEHLVQKLKQLNSTHDEASTDYIASLCENTNPDHRYISEILLASGLLLRDLDSSLTTYQFHPSGHPINPELFFVLEQTKGSTLICKEGCSGTVSNLKPDQGKFHRKLIFDAVNEILVGKLALAGPSPEPWIKPDKLARKTLSAQKLLKELCSEIEQLQAIKSECIIEEKEDDFKSILWKDVMHGSESWTDFCGEISGVVLDVERLIFKDLVDEIVMGESTSARANPGRRCRRLFAK